MSLITLAPVITTVGLTAVFNAQNTGLKCEIAEIALGDGSYTPTEDRVALENEITRVPVSGGIRQSEHQIHITGVLATQVAFWVKEIGFYLADGTLFAVWSDDQPYHTVRNIPKVDSDGTLAVSAYGSALQEGIYKLICVETTNGGPARFVISAPDGTDLGSVNTDTAFSNDHLDFLLTEGGVPWAIDDEIQIRLWLERPLIYATSYGDIVIGFDLLLTAIPPDSITINVPDNTYNMALYEENITKLATVIVRNQITNIKLQEQICCLKKTCCNK